MRVLSPVVRDPELVRLPDSEARFRALLDEEDDSLLEDARGLGL